MDVVKSMAQRLCLEPSPRYLGVNVNHLDVSFDRGAMSTMEAPYVENSRTARSGWKDILSLPQDHVEWQLRQSQTENTRIQEDKLWALEEQYNNRALKFATEEAIRLRRARRQEKEPADNEFVVPGGLHFDTEDAFMERGRLTAEHPMLALSQDYWLSTSKAAADCHAKGVDAARSTRGQWQVPSTRPMTQGRSIASCGREAFRGDSGLQALARRQPDMELREVNTATPAHPCRPALCFPLDGRPPRLDALP